MKWRIIYDDLHGSSLQYFHKPQCKLHQGGGEGGSVALRLSIGLPYRKALGVRSSQGRRVVSLSKKHQLPSVLNTTQVIPSRHYYYYYFFCLLGRYIKHLYKQTNKLQTTLCFAHNLRQPTKSEYLLRLECCFLVPPNH